MKMMSHNLEIFRGHFKQQFMGLSLDDFRNNLGTNLRSILGTIQGQYSCQFKIQFNE